jgi:hypothetical protein
MNINIKKILFIFFFLILILFSTFCNKEETDSNNNDEKINTIYYVSTKGNDNNNGSKQKPWKTITHGINSITGGEKLIILSGIYKEKIEIENKGKNDNRIYI